MEIWSPWWNRMIFHWSCVRISITVCLHHQCSNWTHIVKARWGLYKNTACFSAWIVEVAPHSHLLSLSQKITVSWSKLAGHCWKSKDQIISDVFVRTPTHVHISTRWLAKAYILQLFMETGCSQENLPKATGDRDGWRENQEILCYQNDFMILKQFISFVQNLCFIIWNIVAKGSLLISIY